MGTTWKWHRIVLCFPERTICLMILLVACDGIFLVEQPSSSIITRHRRFRWLVSKLEKLGIRVPLIYIRLYIILHTPNLLKHIWIVVHLGKHVVGVQPLPTTDLNPFLVALVSISLMKHLAEVFLQTFWMKAFGHPTAKRTVVYSNSSKIGLLNTGSMSRTSLACQVQTTRRYVAKDGKVRFAGTNKLKGTQFLRFKTVDNTNGVSWGALLTSNYGQHPPIRC